MSGVERLPYPSPWLSATVYESTSAALYRAGTASVNPLIVEMFGVLQYAQPPRPDDTLATLGATPYQVWGIAALYGLDEIGHAELVAILRANGCSARHAAVLYGGGLQRQHEIGGLQRSLDALDALDTNGEAE